MTVLKQNRLRPRSEYDREFPPYPRYADFLQRKKWTIVTMCAVILLVFAGAIWVGLSPASAHGNVTKTTVTITEGESFSEIAHALDAAHLLRSRLAFRGRRVCQRRRISYAVRGLSPFPGNVRSRNTSGTFKRRSGDNRDHSRKVRISMK